MDSFDTVLCNESLAFNMHHTPVDLFTGLAMPDLFQSARDLVALQSFCHFVTLQAQTLM